ncbi:pseudouridine synthase [Chryseomicrobium palamuruense]|uniref:Pseudouridine synthase n=1 Tax=Chryseomicrobium palamuruense TaxID=682973 RepID=A0ABV8UX13_9BACL
MRMDKFLANMGFGTRKEVKQLIKSKAVTLNEETVKDSGKQFDPEADIVRVYRDVVAYKPFLYLMLNKPSGVISATEDYKESTVIDLLDADVRHYDLHPVGRLDKDTVGLLLLTNDGDLTHQLLSPKKKVPKKYYAHIEGQVTDADVAAFAKGVTLDDGYETKPGKLTILESASESVIELVITEGKFHQVKRMFEAVGKKVVYLKRLEMGSLRLDESLQEGDYRELTQEELEHLY